MYFTEALGKLHSTSILKITEQMNLLAHIRDDNLTSNLTTVNLVHYLFYWDYLNLR